MVLRVAELQMFWKESEFMPKISVIVPVYKVEPYLHRCVDSILNQSYRDFELILVDDGSPDNCGAMCDEYAKTDSRIHVIHRENGGLSAARNTGIEWSFANSNSQ
jgi:glycosyltransferase involved in cell wall biosynthesis